MTTARHRARYLRVGLVTLGAGALFVGLIVFTLGASMRQEKLPYTIQFTENVKGMVVGSKVNFQGVPAGTVTGIRFAGGQSLVEIAVGIDQCVVQDVTRARLDRLLVTGQVTIELEGYESDRPRLPAGASIPPAQNRIDELTRTLPDVVGSVPGVMRQVEGLLVRLNELVGGDNGRRIEAILANVDDASRRMPGMVAEAEAALAALRGLAEGDPARRTLHGLAAAGDRVAVAATDASALLADARSWMAAHRGGFGETLAGMRDAMRDLRALARVLQLAPSTLLYGREVREPAVPAGGGR